MFSPKVLYYLYNRHLNVTTNQNQKLFFAAGNIARHAHARPRGALTSHSGHADGKTQAPQISSAPPAPLRPQSVTSNVRQYTRQKYLRNFCNYLIKLHLQYCLCYVSCKIS